MPARALKRALLVPPAGWAALAAAIAAIAALAAIPAAASAQVTLANWDTGQQRQVVHAGLMSNVRGNDFGGAQRLPSAQADRAMAALAPLADRDSPAPDGGSQTLPVVHAAAGLVTVTAFDRLVIDQLGLGDAAAHVQRATAAVGLRPPSYYGSEVVARFLGLRYDHPAGTDQLELFPWDPITRAEAAWSLAQVMDDGSWSVQSARQTLMAYTLPPMSAVQLTALRIAVSRIGYPYVYAGTTDDTADGLAHGGFDCSGFVWRVFKVSGLPWGRQIGGRTAAQMAQEIPHRHRLRYEQLRPGDLLFFGSAHFNSTATEANVIHTGIYLGDNWVIHSSGQGVYVLPLRGGWLGDQFAWGRRVLP
jgi:cell wall-associated NlpC family hydrolase